MSGLYEDKIRLIDERSNAEFLATLRTHLGDEMTYRIAEAMGVASNARIAAKKSLVNG